ncbi:phosphoethanolamine transferase domain-containing protein [uncultured Planktomarina sp.]|uniref:phosphoethanolamine transferase domain-containing protein n=1 Tax=uncultured Planktomarina sp. TaxID=1538529 RepID=UPI003261451F
MALWLMHTVFALYCMLTFGVEIDWTMVGHSINTDQCEAAELLHLSLLHYVPFLGVIPAVLVLKSECRVQSAFGALP